MHFKNIFQEIEHKLCITELTIALTIRSLLFAREKRLYIYVL